jgi:hypothetical protein
MRKVISSSRLELNSFIEVSAGRSDSNRRGRLTHLDTAKPRHLEQESGLIELQPRIPVLWLGHNGAVPICTPIDPTGSETSMNQCNWLRPRIAVSKLSSTGGTNQRYFGRPSKIGITTHWTTVHSSPLASVPVVIHIRAKTMRSRRTLIRRQMARRNRDEVRRNVTRTVFYAVLLRL